ncbi:MAG: type II toxin-antitoxin system HicB family antitoxin [Methanosarcinaceae archaeon]|nr:type II toxin-antitoxin system HicB family antitoxin [Methanosarcinaceae archaeon]
MDLTAIIKKGDKQFVALCPELDIVSQGYSIEEALDNLKEASDLFIETMGLPDDIEENTTIIARFEVGTQGKTTCAVGA